MKFITAMTLLFTLVGCQSIMEQHKKNMAALCSYDGAYSKGVEHAENEGKSQASQTLSSCDSAVLKQAMKGYNAGYASVMEQENSGTDVIGDLLGSVFGSKNKKSKKKKEGLHLCEIDVFTDSYSAKGASRAEALYKTKTACTTSRNDDFFCKKDSKYKCKKLY